MNIRAIGIWLLGSVIAVGQSVDIVRPPNLVLIIADDLGYGETGMMGEPTIATPGIDALAAAGVRCTSAYVTSSYCSPSRAGMLTGRHQSSFGYDHNPTGQRNFDAHAGLPHGVVTFATELSNRGYATGLIGKWHLGAAVDQHPRQRGFDEFYGFTHEGHSYAPHRDDSGIWTMLRDRSIPVGEIAIDGQTVRGNYAPISEPDYDRDNPIFDGEQEVAPEDYLTDVLTRRAVDYIDRNADRPFALVVSYNAVHSPMQSLDRDMPDEPNNNIQRRIFAGMLTALDRGVSRLVAAIDDKEIRDSTLIVFISDNGGPTAELTSSNAPLRGGKGSLYEGGIRVPMVWSWPGTLPAGETEPRPVTSLDVAATMLATQPSPPPPQPHAGVDVTPWLGRLDAGVPVRPLWFRMPGGKRAIRVDQMKWIQADHRSPPQLFDLSADIGETYDLSRLRPDMTAKLASQWSEINATMTPPLTWANP